MSAAACESRKPFRLNQRITRRRTFSVSVARSSAVSDRVGRNTGGPSGLGMKTPSVTQARQMGVAVEPRAEAVQEGDGAEAWTGG